VGEWIAVYIGVGGTSKLGINTGEWVTIGEEEDQWQTAGGGGGPEYKTEREVYCGREIKFKYTYLMILILSGNYYSHFYVFSYK
jgi:hypothetical protein